MTLRPKEPGKRRQAGQYLGFDSPGACAFQNCRKEEEWHGYTYLHLSLLRGRWR